MNVKAVTTLEQMAPDLLAHYGVAAMRITPISSWNNPVVQVESDGRNYALRWHQQTYRAESHIRAELALLKHLAASGLAVPTPVATQLGDNLLVLSADGRPQYYDLTNWLEGDVRRRDLDVGHARTLGLTLARLHQTSRTLVLPAGATLPHYDSAAALPTELSHREPGPLEPWLTQSELALVAEVTRQAKTVFARLEADAGKMGVLHRDFILGNCLWQEDAVSVLDFADFGVGPYLYDLAPMLTNLDDPQLQASFLEGYTLLCPLARSEVEVLPLMQAVRHVRVCLISIGKERRGEHTPPLREHLDVRFAQVRDLVTA